MAALEAVGELYIGKVNIISELPFRQQSAPSAIGGDRCYRK